MLGTLWLPPLSSILRLCVYLGAAARLRPTPLTAPSALSGTAIAMCFGSDREPGLYRTLSTRCTRWCAACGRPPPPRAARACGARHAAATDALTAPHVGRSLSGCARCSWRSPPPGRSCTAGSLWLSPRPCPRRLNPACTAAARVAARIAIMPCAHVRVDAEYVVAALVLAGSADPGHESGCDRHLSVQARTAMCGAWSGVSAVRSERTRRASAPSDRGACGWRVGRPYASRCIV